MGMGGQGNPAMRGNYQPLNRYPQGASTMPYYPSGGFQQSQASTMPYFPSGGFQQSGADTMAGGNSMGSASAGGMNSLMGGMPGMNANSNMFSGGSPVNGSSPGTGIAPQQQQPGDIPFNARTPVLYAPGQMGPGMPSNMSLGGAQSMGGGFGGQSFGGQPQQRFDTGGGADAFGGSQQASSGPTVGQQYGLSPGDPRYNLRAGDSYAGGVIGGGADGRLGSQANNMSGPLAGTSYGQYVNPTGGGGIGNINGQNEIFGNVYHGEGLNQDNGSPNANSGFNVFLRQQAAAMNQSMPGDPRTQQLNQYLAGLPQMSPQAQTPMGSPTPMQKFPAGPMPMQKYPPGPMPMQKYPAGGFNPARRGYGLLGR